VRAVDRGRPPSVSQPASIVIEITDQNDNAPKFAQDFYSASLSESMDGFVLAVHATDQDHGNFTGEVVDYQIHPASVPFTVSRNGSIYAVEAIDYESFGVSEMTSISS